MVFFFFSSPFTLYIFQHFHIFLNFFFIFCNRFHHFNFVLCGCSSYNHFEFSLLLLQLQAMLMQTAVCVVKLPGSQPFFQNIVFFFFFFIFQVLLVKVKSIDTGSRKELIEFYIIFYSVNRKFGVILYSSLKQTVACGCWK